MTGLGIESEICQRLSEECPCERKLGGWLKDCDPTTILLVAEGFEERSVGLIERLAESGAPICEVVLGRYTSGQDVNEKYRSRFEDAAQRLAPGRWRVVPNENDGLWVYEGLNEREGANVLLDMSGISNRAIFTALNAIETRSGVATVGYTEAQVYWPRRREWNRICAGWKDPAMLSEQLEEQPWVVGQEHRVESLVPFEGYDSPGNRTALIGFLPYKRSRLAAITHDEDYSAFAFIAGVPRLEKNAWRVDALWRINESLVGDSTKRELRTFGYQHVLDELATLLFDDPGLHNDYDIHIAALGSKLQTLACWYLARVLPSLTFKVSVPKQYFAQAFSEGVGSSWVVPLLKIESCLHRWIGRSSKEEGR